MSDITLYDSEGQPLDQSRQENESIRDYFFNGVRFAADISGYQAELICFFRARESSAGRAEQYYAIYSADNLDNFEDDLRRQIEKYGLNLDTSTEDAGVFELVLGDSARAVFPGTQEQLSDLKNLYAPDQSEMSTHASGPQGAVDHSPQNVSVDTQDIPTEQITLGVGTYQQAVGAVKKLRSELGIESFVIADNVTSGDLQNYELVVQKGNYTGMEFIGNTQTAVNTLQSRRKKVHQQLYGDDSDSLFNLNTPQGIAATLSVSIFAGLVLITFGLYAAHVIGGVCLFNLPGLDDCTTEQPTIEIEDVTINGEPLEDVNMLNRSDRLDIEINLSQSVSNSSVKYSFGNQSEHKNATGGIINFTNQNPPIEVKNHTFSISVDDDSREKEIMIDGPQFVVEDLTVDDDEITAGDSINLNVTVQNTGTMNGTGSLQYNLTQHDSRDRQNESINLTLNESESIQRSLQINTTRQVQGEHGYNLTVTVENGRYKGESQSREIQIRNLISLERFTVNGTTQDDLDAQEFEIIQDSDFNVVVTLSNNRESSRLNASVEYVVEPVDQNNDSIKEIEINNSPEPIEIDDFKRVSFEDISLSEIGRYNQSLIISIDDNRSPIVYNIPSKLFVTAGSNNEENITQQNSWAELNSFTLVVGPEV